MKNFHEFVKNTKIVLNIEDLLFLREIRILHKNKAKNKVETKKRPIFWVAKLLEIVLNSKYLRNTVTKINFCSMILCVIKSPFRWISRRRRENENFEF